MILEGTIRLPFSYAAGGIGTQFLIALRDEQRILGARCESCSTVTCPARPFCSQCHAAVTDLIEVGPAGNVVARTETPGKGVFGLIRLDGANTAILHRLVGPVDQWRRGARVSAVFAEERTAGINDIEGFVIEGDQP